MCAYILCTCFNRNTPNLFVIALLNLKVMDSTLQCTMSVRRNEISLNQAFFVKTTMMAVTATETATTTIRIGSNTSNTSYSGDKQNTAQHTTPPSAFMLMLCISKLILIDNVCFLMPYNTLPLTHCGSCDFILRNAS